MTRECRVAIHQPNYFPWLGYFDKMLRSDVFVFLDSAQIPRTGAGSWVNRVPLLIEGEVRWLTLPIDKASGRIRPISDVNIAPDQRTRRKIVDTITHNYRKAPFFKSVYPLLEPLINCAYEKLADYNIHAIMTIVQYLELPERVCIRSSSLPESGETSTDRLVRIVHEVQGTAYIYGGGAKATGGYQEDDKFLASGISPLAQNFQHPHYVQFNSVTFQPGLSIIDALMNVGVAGVRGLLIGDQGRGADIK